MSISSKQITRLFVCLTLLFCYSSGARAENSGEPNIPASGSTVRATHVLGLPGVSRNATGELSIQDHALRFQKNHASLVQISVESIQGVSWGEEDKQIGGVPMMLGKAAAPYGGGRVISLFSHKKYDTVTLEYVDAGGAFHGVIFQLHKGKGQVLESEFETEDAHFAHPKNETTVRGAQEFKSEIK